MRNKVKIVCICFLFIIGKYLFTNFDSTKNIYYTAIINPFSNKTNLKQVSFKQFL